jgi:cysteinyl-tRNA synthetase
MIAGARVEVAPYKRGPMDFVLWKPSGPKEPGWESPWGRGRPGWHIECSAMSWKHLGEVFDIHGGGIDLVFPHHENEIAQSCSAFGHDVMANFWMHNGHLQVEGQKMAKSLGNFVTIRDLWASDKFGGRKWKTGTLRLAMLMTHYREPIDWSVKRCSEAEAIIDSWIEPIDLLDHCDFDPEPSAEVVEALSDDLDSPAAITALHGLAKQAHGNLEVAKKLAKSLIFLGIIPRVAALSPDQLAAMGSRFLAEVKKYRKHASGILLSKIVSLNLDIDAVNRSIEQRNAARAAKNWAEADRIRGDLAAQGIVLKDNKDGTTTWEVQQ